MNFEIIEGFLNSCSTEFCIPGIKDVKYKGFKNFLIRISRSCFSWLAEDGRVRGWQGGEANCYGGTSLVLIDQTSNLWSKYTNACCSSGWAWRPFISLTKLFSFLDHLPSFSGDSFHVLLLLSWSHKRLLQLWLSQRPFNSQTNIFSFLEPLRSFSGDSFHVLLNW